MPFDEIFEALFELPEEAISLLGGKKARKKLKKAAKKAGGGAALASLGYFAYRNWQAKGGGTGASPNPAPFPPAPNAPPPLPPSPPPATIEEAAREVAVSECLKMNLILAMIAAASADGEIDATEMDRLVSAIEDANLDPPEKARLTGALNRPPLLEDVAALAFSPLEACELYGAAVTAIEVDSPAETLFLRRFAKALKLDDDLVATVEETVRSLGDGGSQE